MISRDFLDAYSETAIQIETLRGLVAALVSVMDYSEAINHQAKGASSITSLIRTIHEKAEVLPEIHELEWAAAKAKK